VAASLGFTDFIDLPYRQYQASVPCQHCGRARDSQRAKFDGLSPDDKTVERLGSMQSKSNARDDILFTCRKPMP